MPFGDAAWEELLEAARQMGSDPDLADLTDADVEREVRDGASRIAAQTCQYLVHLAELVVRGVWADQGARTPGQWLAWACSESGSTAREHVRVALALRHLPRIRERFAAGTLSYSKVRAITRCAVPEIEQSLIDLADSAPASHLERILAQARRSADAELRLEEGVPAEDLEPTLGDVRKVRVGPDTVELRIRLTDADADAVLQRTDRLVELEDRADAPAEDGDAEAGARAGAPREPLGARRARAICGALATAVAADPPDRSGVDDHLVVLHVDAADLATAVPDDQGTADAGGASAEAEAASAAPPGRRRRGRARVVGARGRAMHVPRSVLARLTCDADLRLVGDDARGHPADIGRRSRQVPADLRRALQLRDRHCRFPGCHRTRHLHAHHVVHWADGGPTDLANLLLLCSFHHRFVHDRGWTLRPHDPLAGRWTFHAPDADTPLAPVLPMPGASAEAADGHDGSTVRPYPQALQPPWWDGWYDLDETIRIVSEYLLDLSPVPFTYPPHPAMAA